MVYDCKSFSFKRNYIKNTCSWFATRCNKNIFSNDTFANLLGHWIMEINTIQINL